MMTTIQDIRSIEDRELRWLVKYEQIIAWSKAGGFKKAAAAYHAQIAEAERQKAVAELRVAQINVITTTVAAYDGKAVRNAQIAQVAAQHRADAAERQAIQEAVDEVLALDDILSEISKALGIELPTEADKSDICQRGPKSIDDLKRQLGPSLVDHARQDQADTAETLIAEIGRTAKEYGWSFGGSNENWAAARTSYEVAEGALTDFVVSLIDRDIAVTEPERGHSLWDQRMAAHNEDGFTGLAKTDRFAKLISDHSICVRDFHHLRANTDNEGIWVEFFDRMIASRNTLYEAISTLRDQLGDVLDEETLDLGWKAANDQFDTGKTLAEIGWKRPDKAVASEPSPKVDPERFASLLDEYKTAVASYVSVNTKPCQVLSAELLRRREDMLDHEHRLHTYVSTGEIRPLGDGRVFEHNGIKFTMRLGAFENPAHKPASKPAPQVEERLLETLLDWHEAGVTKLAKSRPPSASYGQSDLYLEGVDALRYAVKDYRKAIMDYVFGRENQDVNAARMAT